MKTYPIAIMVRHLLRYQNLMAAMIQTVQMEDRIQITIKMIPRQIFQFRAQVQESQETVCKFQLFYLEIFFYVNDVVIIGNIDLSRCAFSYRSNAGFR